MTDTEAQYLGALHQIRFELEKTIDLVDEMIAKATPDNSIAVPLQIFYPKSKY